jgi:hypothetical protein
MAIPDEAWRRKARMALFGTDWNGRSAVFTPIAPMYRRLVGESIAMNGWWPSAIRNDALIVKVPQGSAVIDAVVALPQNTMVTFVGLAGALRGQPTGAVVDPSVAFLADPRDLDLSATPTATLSTVRRTYAVNPSLEGLAAATVRCLAESTLLHERLSSIADCVDMESAHVFGASLLAGHHARCLLVVSDSNQDGAVFASEVTRLRPSLDQVCDSILSELVEGIR